MVAVIGSVQLFFLFVMIVHTDPFATYLTEAPVDGRGLNPLLQNPYMVIHPPSLYTGLVGMTIPYAFGMAALITGYLDDSWLRAVRRWTMFSWLFLTLGLTLGMIWAYEELGWGGFWGWDPVENAGALPWFTATAFLHSVMVQERRSMLRVWNVTLVILTFFLTIVATFLTRSGIVQSVHAFGEDAQLTLWFSIFMGIVMVFSFGWVIYRLPLLRARNDLESWVSREAAFLLNNWILLFSAFFILFATLFPTLSEAVTGVRITVGPPFFNKWMVPIGLTLLFLTGVGPLLAWRKSSVSNLGYQFLWPTTAAFVTMGALYAAGFRVWISGLAFGLCAFVLGTISQEFIRGANVRREATGTDLLTAMIGLMMRSRRRYGGYIIHVGIVLMFLGFAGVGYKQSAQVLLEPGEQVEVGRFVVRHDRLSETDDGRKQMITAHMTVFRDGEQVGEMFPARWFFRKHESEPTTEVAIRRSVSEDLYITLAQYDIGDQSASFQVTVNPLVNWVWFGFGILALGTGIALLPESAFAFVTARVPAGAATTSVLILALSLAIFATPARVQNTDDHRVLATPESYGGALSNQLAVDARGAPGRDGEGHHPFHDRRNVQQRSQPVVRTPASGVLGHEAAVRVGPSRLGERRDSRSQQRGGASPRAVRNSEIQLLGNADMQACHHQSSTRQKSRRGSHCVHTATTHRSFHSDRVHRAWSDGAHRTHRTKRPRTPRS